MFSVVILMILVAVFIILAARNWKTTIGAGPTILIVGAIVVSAFGAVKWADYQGKLQDYNSCVQRVERSQDSFKFNDTLVNIIENAFGDDAKDAVTQLRGAMLQPIKLATCGTKPDYFTSFTEGVVRAHT